MYTPLSERIQQAWRILIGAEEENENQDLLDEISELKSELNRMKLLKEYEEVSKAFANFGTFLDEKNEFVHDFKNLIDILDIENFMKNTSKVERENILGDISRELQALNKEMRLKIRLNEMTRR